MNIDYNYCIWLINNKINNWEKKEKGFLTHMSIKTHLKKNEAILLFNQIKKDIDFIKLTINSELIESNDESGFNALYYNVSGNKKFSWWPDNAHVSFHYKYNEAFSIKDKEYKPKKNWCIFNDIIIMKCTGHHKDWTQLYLK